jgi:uncharacterized protein YggE
MRQFLPFFLLLPSAFAFGQLDSYTATITASRTPSAVPDQATLSLSLTTDLQTGPDTVVSALQSLGITIANLTGLSNENEFDYTPSSVQVQHRASWAFSLTVPLASANATIASVGRLSDTLFRSNGWNLIYSLQSIQSSSNTAQQCTTADLIADARAQATALASAAGFSVGGVVAMSDGSNTPLPPSVEQLSEIITFNIGATEILGGISFYTPASPVPSCTAVVKFRLTGGV